ncbi:MAG: Septum site-determining protein MinD [Firmicutes bacterium ADurb.Bin182]|nr:MAG: Septum site-determining protein MinD [Firmicutes bacterium ADurb.Bin182]
MARFKVLAVVSDENLRVEIRQALMGIENIALVGFASFDTSLMTKVTGYSPHAVLLVQEGDDAGVFEYARQIYKTYPGCALVLLTEDISIQSIEKAMLSGFRKVMDIADIATKELPNAIFQSVRLEQGRNNEIRNESRVISVYGTKGGSGRTTLATNLATAFAQDKHRTALIDLCLVYGDASIYLDINAKDTISELVQERADFTIDDIKSFCMQHSSGINVLCAPSRPEYAEYVTGKHVEKIINLMRPYYDYIVVDLPCEFNDCTLSAIENSDDVLVVTLPEISSLRNTKLALSVFNNLQQIEKVKIVMNCWKKGALTQKDFERVLEVPVSFSVPEDLKNVSLSVERGIPYVIGMPRSPMARAVRDLVVHFHELRGGAEA